jgi:hypothetical protein
LPLHGHRVPVSVLRVTLVIGSTTPVADNLPPEGDDYV